MEKVLKTGKAKAIGVANFSVKFLEELLPQASVVPAANQIENHPYLPQSDITDYCKEKGIHVTAYSPLGSTGSPLFEEEGVQEIAKKHDVKPGTVLLSYQGQIAHFADVTHLMLTVLSRSRAFCHPQVGHSIAD